MTPEKQRIAIAEFHLGLLPIPGERVSDCGHLVMLNGDGSTTTFCPDYTGDLNAMHEAEKMLSIEDRPAYASHLYHSSLNIGTSAWEAAHATAAQRAESFLRTIEKWEEAK